MTRDNFKDLIKNFLNQSNTQDLSTNKYQNLSFLNTSVKVGFGKGIPSKISWIAFIDYDQTVMKGIYPVILYNKRDDILVVAYGVSQAETPNFMWPDIIRTKYPKIKTLGWINYYDSYYKSVFEHITSTGSYDQIYDEIYDEISSIIEDYNGIFLNKAFNFNYDTDIYFIKNGNDIPNDVKKKQIFIFPSNDVWNDFTYKIHCKYIYYSGGLKLIEKDLLLGFLDDNIKSLDSLMNTKILNVVEVPTFFTLQTSMQDYRDIVDTLGLLEAKSLLNNLNDLVALNKYRGTPVWVKDAIKTKVFSLSFMRNPDTFFTFYNAASILDGTQLENISTIDPTFGLKFKLPGIDNEHIINFKFDHKNILPTRINILIGKNGVGKSQTLNKLVESILNMQHRNSRKNYFIGKSPTIHRVLAIGTPGETSSTFPSEKNNSFIYYKRLLLTRKGNRKNIRGTGELLKQLARSTDSIQKKTRWSFFLDSLERILPLDEIFIPLSSSDSNSQRNVINSRIIHIQNNRYINISYLNGVSGEQASLEMWNAVQANKEPVRITDNNVSPLSSGQLSFLKFAVQICLHIENGTLVLLDEPETHLHPNLIGDFIDLLDQLLAFTGSLSVIATHSSYLVREVPREQVHVYKLNNKWIDVLTPRLKTFGANIGDISFFVFDDDITNRLIRNIKERIQAENDIRKKMEIYNDLKDELSVEVRMNLLDELNLREL